MEMTKLGFISFIEERIFREATVSSFMLQHKMVIITMLRP